MLRKAYKYFINEHHVLKKETRPEYSSVVLSYIKWIHGRNAEIKNKKQNTSKKKEEGEVYVERESS